MQNSNQNIYSQNNQGVIERNVTIQTGREAIAADKFVSIINNNINLKLKMAYPLNAGSKVTSGNN